MRPKHIELAIIIVLIAINAIIAKVNLDAGWHSLAALNMVAVAGLMYAAWWAR